MISKEWEDFLNILKDDSLIRYGTSKTYDSVKALVTSLDTKGGVDIPYMEGLSGLMCDELVKALHGVIFQDPEKYEEDQNDKAYWMIRPQYLSGDLKEKLEIAIRANKKYEDRFKQNIQAIEEVMPEPVSIEDIGISIGSLFIPLHYYEEFEAEKLGINRARITYSKILGKFHLEKYSSVKDSVKNTYTYGTQRAPFTKLFEDSLNGITTTVHDEEYSPIYLNKKVLVLNKTETLAAQEKQALIQREFEDWVLSSPRRCKTIEDIFYNHLMRFSSVKYDGSFLTLPDLNKEKFNPYKHQKDSVARIIFEKDVLLNHKVGSGKTAIIIMGIHEKKRLGLSEKNLVVVPNAVLNAFENEHKKMYPEDKILVIHPKDFTPKNRENSLQKMMNGDYTAIYMAYSSFEKIIMSKEYELLKKDMKATELKSKIAASYDSWEKRKLESELKKVNKDLTEMLLEPLADEYTPFDKLGITTFVVDEAHNFKNITLKTRIEGVVGMHVNGSKKCDSMYEKSQYVRNNGGSLILSTGTPLTNSIADLFVLQKFLQPEQLELLGLDHFDSWITNFAKKKTGFEIDVDSQNYRVRTRFSSFHNIPELTSLFANVCDYYDGTNNSVVLPKCQGYIDVICPKLPEQTEYMNELVSRTELIRSRAVRSKDDNLLKVFSDGKLASLDPRLVNPISKPDFKMTKIYKCAEKIYEIHKKYPGKAQIVFCDSGTPKKGFNVYDELKAQLVALGIPSGEIAFVHDATTDAKRNELFRKTNQGKISVLIGSSSKLGEGVNVQESLIALHHLDVPLKPSMIIQREGRILRQGNSNSETYIYRYVTQGTFDSYSWQILENKIVFISQFMNNNLSDRSARDIDDVVLSYAEIKALAVGDPLLKKRIETSNELERTKIKYRHRKKELGKLSRIVETTPDLIKDLTDKKNKAQADLIRFGVRREKLAKEERDAFGEELLIALADNVNSHEERTFDFIHGFKVVLPKNMTQSQPYVYIKGFGSYKVDMTDATKIGGCILRIEHILLHLDQRISNINEEIIKNQEECKHAETEIAKGNEYEKNVSLYTKALIDIDEELERKANEKIDKEVSENE